MNEQEYSAAPAGAQTAPGWLLILVLHLVPGALITFVFFTLARYGAGSGRPAYTALMFTIAVCLVPVELGIMWLWRAAKQRTGGGEAVLAYGRKGTLSDYTVLPVLLFALFAIISLAAYPLQQAVEARWAALVPEYARTQALFDGLAGASVQQRNTAFLLGFLLSGLAAPVVEEAYFRGFLLPRMKAAGPLAPVLNTLLFSVYHFFAPWNVPVIFVAFIPIVFVVWLKKDFMIGVVTHCMINVSGVVQVILFTR